MNRKRTVLLSGAVVLCVCAIAVFILWNPLQTGRPEDTAPGPASSAVAETASNSDIQEIRPQGLVAYMSLDDLKDDACLVVAGTIIGVSEPYQIQAIDADMIWHYTDYYLKPSNVLRGEWDSDEAITIRTRGGLIDNINFIYDVEPEYQIGEEYIVFLGSSADDGIFRTEDDTYRTCGLYQGCYRKTGDGIYQDKNEKTITLDAFITEMLAYNEHNPVDMEKYTEERLQNLEEQLAGEHITQKEYDDAITIMDKTATVIR